MGVPPRMYGVAVRRSVYGGINITAPDSLVIINNCTVEENAGATGGAGQQSVPSTKPVPEDSDKLCSKENVLYSYRLAFLNRVSRDWLGPTGH